MLEHYWFEVQTPKELTLTKLIEKLEAVPQNAQLLFDFVNFAPTRFQSAKDYCKELTLEYKALHYITVSEFLTLCRNTIGMEFETKGGELVKAWKHSFIYVGMHEESSIYFVKDVEVLDETLVLLVTDHL